ncbi:Glucosidase 2 subunit beta [Smittium culicis]|uniref:Glucosidase 2 subunit beta n=1 Tax=Smittium culicis TaxID=133412 RepID=A0A1R1YIY8_9FUNG|nr:Glucosidase 2 subunit beta [Smittium culicis]
MFYSKVAYFLAASLSCASANSIKNGSDGNLRGVAPSELTKYVPDADGMFTCFDGKKKIPFDRVNDDYCDCEDGSDEPGTSACNNGRFYCKNIGHVPVYIDSSKVNDGFCDEECCDGSDEWSGIVKCPDTCLEKGKAFKENAEKKRLNEYNGGLVKQKLKLEAKRLYEQMNIDLIEKAKPKDELNAELSSVEALKTELEAKEKEINERKNKASEIEKQKLSADNLQTVIQLRRYNSAKKKSVDFRIRTLAKILSDLESGHNKEYDDKAVTTALTTFNDSVESNFRLRIAVESSKLIDANGNIGSDESEKVQQEQEESSFTSCHLAADSLSDAIKETEADILVLSQILDNLEKDYNRNFHDLAVKGATAEYVKLRGNWEVLANTDVFAQAEADKWKAVVDEVANKLQEIEQNKSSVANTPEEEQILKDLADTKSKFFDLKGKITHIENEIKNINDVINMDLGPDSIFLAVKDNCTAINLPEYTYEVCMFGSASQKVIKDGSNLNLGKFDGFLEKNDADGKAVKDYNVHMFLNGAHCWNGPNRSVQLIMDCGPEFIVESVSEPEKCVYHITMKSPTACPDLQGEDLAKANELLKDILKSDSKDEPEIKEGARKDEL